MRTCAYVYIVMIIIISTMFMYQHNYMSPPKLNSLSGKTVLVTGGAGFIGHHVIMELLGRDVHVVGIDNFNDYYNTSLKYARSEISNVVQDVDVCDSGTISDLFDEYDFTHVIHLAAQAGVRYSIDHPQAYVKSNVECFVQLLEVLKNRNVPLVYASSSSVYGKNTKVPFSESDPVVQPVSLYAATKRENELLAHVYWDMHGLKSMGLRFFTVYGPMGRPDMAYYSFTKNIVEGRPIAVFNHGRLSRDFTYISDIVDGIVRSLQVDFEYEILNLGRGQPQELMAFIYTIEATVGKKAILEYQDMAKGDVLTTYADVSKARMMLGYNPKVSLKEGIHKFAEWYKKHY